MRIPYNHSCVGTCNICDGPVVIFTGPWMGILPPKKHCASCGAVPKENYGPLIPMTPTYYKRDQSCLNGIEKMLEGFTDN